MLSRSRFPSEVYPLLDNHLTSLNLDGKESACNAGHPGLIPGSGRSPGEGMATQSGFFPGESHGQRSLAGYRP